MSETASVPSTSPSSPMNEPLTSTCTSLATSPETSMTIIEENEPSSATTEFIVDDAELLSILAINDHANANVNADTIQPPTVAVLDWEDWNQEVPEFINNNKRKRNDDDNDGQTSLGDSDDDEEEFNFLDQFDFVDVSFDYPSFTESNKKQKTNINSTNTTNFVDENADDLSTLLKQTDSFMAELDCSWVLDITS
ncbi:hypothetical protein BCR42DRAFT_423421 [Absidia repens]|uniref:Uncharacterized protein n=1 Tax=Absidia repens TaxID=90262 RepID=A0A1X2I5R7_9FUNG|nr:hypothetical protein BCR42DRAFT_423421 [Absidia repens]